MSRAAKHDRALGRHRHVIARAGDFDRAAVQDASAKLAEPPPSQAKARGRGRPRPKAFPTGDVRRWVPIGPAVVRRGQGGGRPRVSGRIRDVAVSTDGQRVYAASAMGGVWYSADGGTSWDPVGGWADREARSGGANNAQSCGALLVDFGATAAGDVVLVGTGEAIPTVSPIGETSFGGLGILAATRPATAAVGANPWEPEAGIGVLEGAGVFRLVREPGATAGRSTGADRDRVLAATSGGLFMGTRTHVGAPAPAGHDEYQWTKLTSIDQLAFGAPAPPPGSFTPPVTDVVWLSGRVVVVALAGAARGVAVSTDDGSSFAWVPGCNDPVSATGLQGRSSLAMAPGSNRLYILTALAQTPGSGFPDTPALFQVPDITVAGAVVQRVGVVPIGLWDQQRDYDQAIAVDVVAGTDRVYLGGAFFDLDNDPSGATIGASLWCFDVVASPPGPPAPATPWLLRATAGVARRGAPAPPPPPAEPAGAGEGADRAGLIGNNVHADVHRIVLAGAAPNRQVWVGCDGGVYLSTQAGRVNTFSARSTGMAVLQPTFVAAHPTSTHFVASGFQDNGTQVRSGDTLWEEILVGDGGGTVFHPRLSQYVISQWVTGSWFSLPRTGFVGPIARTAGGGVAGGDREDQQGISDFYSGASVVATGVGSAARLALGTQRVWISDNVGLAGTNTWRVLPYPNGAAGDPRFPGGGERAGQSYRGVPTDAALGPLVPAPFVGVTGNVGPMFSVVTVKWQSPTNLLVLFNQGVIRWVEAPAGQWTANVVLTPATVPAGTVLTDIAVVPGSRDFYLTTTGDPNSTAIDTCYLWDDLNSRLVGTGLRAAMNPASPPAPAGTFGPLDPAYSVVVDPASTSEVYVGTVTAVWRGVRAAFPSTNHAWPRPGLVNGLPQAAVQDLSIWHDAADAAAPRLLRAGVQARGVWEVDLRAATEPARTYLRVHARDDRRRLPTPMANPRRSPTAAPAAVFASPDLTVRPRQDPAVAPAYAGQVISAGNVPAYQLWTFQTAFRWLYPSVVPSGLWTDAFGDLVQLERARRRLTAGRFIDRRLWEGVVGGTRLAPDLTVSDTAGHPLAVYRPPWQTPLAPGAVATEVDLLESVQPRSVVADRWVVHSEPSTVDVLLHHRDTRRVPPGDAYAMLLWRSGPSGPDLLTTSADGIVTWARGVAGGGSPAVPAGWRVGGPAPGRNPLTVALDARLPRAVPVDVDLTAVDAHHRVLFVGIAASAGDRCVADPVGLPAGAGVVDLAQRWPYAALRLVSVTPR